ncbi:hypothetical protein NA56DRAFT_716297 [Hyaloscypha hepaticicola]|uniref:Uncharacterized protein n=1 Tax=Hyaloscypha hepaticicola TaxID=2082293 RepID=A0A2J6QBY9_9HELO|nr:hypothetical protein NA56DRAFT_716297 [Hyaloscypha hepaticicola]
MILTRDVVEKLERDEEGTAMDGSPTHANSLWLDPRYPPSTTPAKEERVAIIHHAPSPSAHARFSAGPDLANIAEKGHCRGEISIYRKNNADRTEVSACPIMVFSTRNNPRTPRMALAFSGRLCHLLQFQSGHGSHALFNLGEGRLRQHRQKA